MGIYKRVQRARERGIIKKKSCQKCGTVKTYAHHEDYGKPLEIMWLCQKCHIARHKELGWGVVGRKKIPCKWKYNFSSLGVFEYAIMTSADIFEVSASAHQFKTATGRQIKCMTTSKGILVIRIH